MLKLVNGLILVVIGALAGAASDAQTDIDFGNDIDLFIGDDFCRDARFVGAKALGNRGNRYETHQDASDCRALYEAEEIRCLSRRRCADESRETLFQSLDVRRSLVEDQTDGLAPEQRAMIYVEPQQTRGPLQFVAVNGAAIRSREIILLEPGAHRIRVSWESPRSTFDMMFDSRTSDARRARSATARFGSDQLTMDRLRQAFTQRGEQEFDITLEPGRIYRVHPTSFHVSDASLVEFPITWGPGTTVDFEEGEGAMTLAVWVVDLASGEIVLDQRDDFPTDVRTITEIQDL